MKNKVTLAISTFVLCSSITTAEAAKHHSINKSSKHNAATAHKTSHHTSSKSHSKHAHHITHHTLASHRSRFHEVADGNQNLGMASLYSTRFQGKKTANGERYDMFELTAAHKTLPLDSYVEVTNLENNRSVVVRINDRGPFHGNRVMDLSTAAAQKLGIQGGAEKVKITPLAMNDESEATQVLDE